MLDGLKEEGLWLCGVLECLKPQKRGQEGEGPHGSSSPQHWGSPGNANPTSGTPRSWGRGCTQARGKLGFRRSQFRRSQFRRSHGWGTSSSVTFWGKQRGKGLDSSELQSRAAPGAQPHSERPSGREKFLSGMCGFVPWCGVKGRGFLKWECQDTQVFLSPIVMLQWVFFP